MMPHVYDAGGTRSPCSHYDVIDTTPTVTDVHMNERTNVRTPFVPLLIYKDYYYYYYM